jgi:hypothetical protein
MSHNIAGMAPFVRYEYVNHKWNYVQFKVKYSVVTLTDIYVECGIKVCQDTPHDENVVSHYLLSSRLEI